MDSKRHLKKKKKAKTKAIFLFMLCAIMFMGFAYLYNFASDKKQDLDNCTLCPKVGAKSITVILMDQTDFITPVQSATIKQYILDVKNQIEINGALQIFTIDRVDKELIKSIFNACNPGRKKDANFLIQNPEKIERKWTKQFSEKLDAVINSILVNSQKEISPIFESIQSLNATAFIGDEKKSVPKKLIIISDMIQNSDLLNQYREQYTFDEFKEKNTFAKANVNLENIDVEILYIRRDIGQKIQGKKHMRFWENYFLYMKAKIVDVHSID